MSSSFPPSTINHRVANGLNGIVRRPASMTRDGTITTANLHGLGANGVEDEEREEDPIRAMLRQRWAETESNIAALFGTHGSTRRTSRRPNSFTPDANITPSIDTAAVVNAKTSAPSKKAARTIDDDYGDDDDEEDQDEVEKESPLKAKGKAAASNSITSHAVRSPAPLTRVATVTSHSSSLPEQAKSSEDVRKELEEEKKAAAEGAKRSFQSMFFTFEHDRDAMLEQQKLDELDREVENEISGVPNGDQDASAGITGGAAATQGSLGSADLGASSLTLKHLIARIDAKRQMVKASDDKLRTLISEVRKGRSKWASEDKVGQEELYEAAEKVLMELKAMTEYAQPFLQRVSKREAPDYSNVIKHPMDIGTMIRKLKQFSYKSKKEFVEDLNLIWGNCLKYNSTPDHPFRKKALYMRKETDKLTPLIPEIVVRDRAEVEAEERRQHSPDADDSDEDEPIMASRGRKAPKKGASKGASSSARKAPAVAISEKPVPDVKPAMHVSASSIRNEFLRAESEAQDASSTGFSTPPPAGTGTPFGVNGVHSTGIAHSQTDLMDIDGVGPSLSITSTGADEDDTELKTWKQVTKKDRAMAAAERNRLFRGQSINGDEPALLRTKAMMRRWIRQQKNDSLGKAEAGADSLNGEDKIEESATETLAEGIEKDEDSTLPDYYHALSAIPDLDERWRWVLDSEGHVVPQIEDWMRIHPNNQFKSAQGSLNRKVEANMRQMQDTRKICSKIGIVKQMQLQGQTYQNQFQKYEPEPFVERDVGPVVVSEDGPLMAPWVNRAAFQRSVGKIFYHAGFEDFQPSALETVTDIASNFLTSLVHGFKCFDEHSKLDADSPRFTAEERVLHTLHERGLDIESLETYVKDDVERLSTKLGVVHERMKSHLTDLLRPALDQTAGADGAGAFNDGSDQFASGDFADEMGDDFFGFKELGLADELGLETLSVPFHLLQNRMHSAYQSQHQGPVSSAGLLFEPPAPYDPITIESLPLLIGPVQDFFRRKLSANRDEPLVEDEDLPQKQRFPKPRLPPTGKISSPRKRPIREQQQAAKKKRKLDEDEREARLFSKPVGSLRLQMPESQWPDVDPEKEGEANGAMISPESLTAN